MSKRKILVIENQSTQFCAMHGLFYRHCKSDFDIFPKQFFPFITYVRRYVNENYPHVLRIKQGFDKIIELITDKSNHIELILMDYKLGAAFECLSGVILAKDINKKLNELKKQDNDIKPLPVVFMSKDQEDTEKHKKELEIYKEENFPDYKWVHKGYFGREILQKDYFEDIMIPAIKYCLLEDNKYQKCIKIIDDLIVSEHAKLPAYKDRREKLINIKTAILNKKIIKQNTVDYIILLKGCTDFSNVSTDKLNNYLEE